MTQTQSIDPVRWQDLPARVIVLSNNSDSRVYYQVTCPLNISAMCQGRPVEEIPRILTILSSAHHLVSARALDRLFDVVPPPLAVNMREALLQTQFLTGHLRKLYFLLSAFESPFQDSASSRRGTSQMVFFQHGQRHYASPGFGSGSGHYSRGKKCSPPDGCCGRCQPLLEK